MVQKRIECDDEKKKNVWGQKSDLGVISFSVCIVWSEKLGKNQHDKEIRTHARLGLRKKTGLDLMLFPRLFFHSFGRLWGGEDGTEKRAPIMGE